MKRRKPVAKDYPEAAETAAQIKDNAAHYGLRRDVFGVREAKDQLSTILQRAAAGEEIVITTDGVPTAMLVRYVPIIRGKPYQPNLDLLRSMAATPDSTAILRKERDSRP